MRPLDLAIVVAYLASVLAVGAWMSRRQKTTRHYFTGGGKIPWWAVCASIVATETSTVTFISVPGIAYARGGDFTFLQLALGYVVGRIAISLLFVPRYFEGELLTVYELLTRRFGLRVKALLAALFVGMRTIGDGIRLLLTATVLAMVYAAFSPGAPFQTVVVAATVSLGLVMILFTLWGGMEAVIWIEVVQLAIYLGGAIAAAAVLVGKVPGGLGGAIDVAAAHGKFHWLDFHFAFEKSAGFTFFGGVVGGAFLTMSTHGTDQYLVQRYLCVEGPRRAQAALLLSGVVVFVQFVLFLGIGALLFAHYRPFDAADYASGSAAAPFGRGDEVFPAFLTRELPSGLAGLVVAAILAAALSSSLNSIAATTVNDLVKPFARARDDASWLRASRVLTLVAGIAQIAAALACLRSERSALDSVLSVAALVNGPVLGVFLLGAFTRRAGPRAALVALAVGAAVATALFFSSIHWSWYTAAGSLATLAAGAVAGLFEPAARNAP